MVMDYRDYVEALEEERRKIQVFHRELPLSLHLVTQAIESCRQMMEIDDEGTSCENGPILEEFIPVNSRKSSLVEAEDSFSTTKRKNQEISEKKPDWLRSVQLWSPLPDPHHDEEDDTCRQTIVADPNKGCSAFHPFLRRKRSQSPLPGAGDMTKLSSGSDGKAGKVSGDDKDSNQHRKARRCWSPELHRRFLDALQQLGGSHVATPKQIRDLMKVEGLTNDEVKSHLQKYRLHSRRPSTAMSPGGAGSAPPHQVVFLGGLWVPPREYATPRPPVAAEGIGGPTIYAPVASLPIVTHKQEQAKLSQRTHSGPMPNVEDKSTQGGNTQSNSPATSSSSHTTPASHFNNDNPVRSY